MNKKKAFDIVVKVLAVWGVILTLYEVGMKILVKLYDKGCFNSVEFNPDEDTFGDYEDEEDEISDEDFFNV